MHSFSEFFPVRNEDDSLDCASLIIDGLKKGQSRTFLRFAGQAVTGADLQRHVACYQHWLASQGLQPGDRVAVMLGNSAYHIYLIYALILSGIVWVPVNTKLRTAGLDYLIGHAEPKLFISEDEFAHVLGDVTIGSTRRVDIQAVIGHQAAIAELTVPSILPSDALSIIYTSGTTGAPKGVVLTHRMLRIAAESALLVGDMREGDRPYVWEPLCHIGGAQMLLLPFLEAVEMYIVPRFSARRFWSDIEQSSATHLHYLGGVLDIVMQLPVPDKQKRDHLRVAWGAGMGASGWAAVEANLGLELRECYGMTECSSFATLNKNGKPGSIGRPLPWIEVELLDDDGRPVPDGQAGQMVLSTRVEGTFLPGYLSNPEATSKALKDGKLFTGDRARRDADGDLFFVGRNTDSMRVRGENVSAWEVERAFVGHPAIAAVAAIGVAASVGEQEIMLFVKFADESLGWAELHDWATERLASYQLPRYYKATREFELTASERIKKHLLPSDVESAWDRTSLQHDTTS
jgi:carnitine-CoA ligase